MRCPRCNRVVPEQAASCPACGEELVFDVLEDHDLLWEDSLPAPDDEVAPGTGVFTSAQGTAELEAHLPQPAATGRQAFGGGMQASISTRIVQADPEKNRDTRIVDISVPAVVRRAAAKESPSAPQRPGAKSTAGDEALDKSIEQLGESIRMLYARMHRVDRTTFWVNLAALVSAFLPWRYAEGEGLFSGIEGLGAASAAGAAIVGLCIYVRTVRRRLAGLVLLGQLVLAAGVVAVPVYQFFEVPGLQFHVGLYATAVLGGLVIVLTFMRMAVRS